MVIAYSPPDGKVFAAGLKEEMSIHAVSWSILTVTRNMPIWLIWGRLEFQTVSLRYGSWPLGQLGLVRRRAKMSVKLPPTSRGYKGRDLGTSAA